MKDLVFRGVGRVVLLALGACARVEDPGVEETQAPVVAADLLRGRELVSHAWDDGGRVPCLAPGALDELRPGELGRSALTGPYLTFAGDLERECALQPEEWSVAPAGLTASAGRFGSGVRLASRSTLRVTHSADAPALAAWTVELWLRPASGTSGTLLGVPGLFLTELDSAGRLSVRLTRAAPQGALPVELAHPVPLPAERWSHVAIVLDLQDARALRVVVDGIPCGAPVDPRQLAAEHRELVVGDVGGDGRGLVGELDELRLEARNRSTAELAEYVAGLGRSPRRLRLALADGTEEELDLGPPALADALIDSAEEWAQGELAHAYVAGSTLAWTREHWQRLASADHPVARTTHPVVSLGERRVFVFGGETRDTHLGPTTNTNDTWILDLESARWSRIPTPDALLPRCHMAAAYSPDHDFVMVTGGWWQGGWWRDEAPAELADTWLFHVGERRWEERQPVGDLPGRVVDNGLVYLPSRRCFLAFVSNHTLTYDPSANRWERQARFEVEDGGDAPQPGCYSVALDPTTEQALLFGGSLRGGELQFSDRTALFDPATNRLTVLHPPVAPSARVRGAMGYDPVRRRFVLYGGVRGQDSIRFGDLWTFDPREGRWSEVAPTTPRPSARGGFFGLGYDERADRFVVPCGRHALDRWLAETWTFALDERRRGTARYRFDRATFDADEWFTEADVPPGCSFDTRFRSSPDGLRFGPWSNEVPAGRYLEVEVTLTPDGSGVGPRLRVMGFRERR